MSTAGFFNQLGCWLIQNKGYFKLGTDVINSFGETTLPGDYFYLIDGNTLYLIKLIDTALFSEPELLSNAVSEFHNLEQLQAKNNFQVAYQINIYAWSKSVSPELQAKFQNTKLVSAVSRCYLLPWLADLAERKTYPHKGLPLSKFGLLSPGSPLLNPAESGVTEVNLNQIEQSIMRERDQEFTTLVKIDRPVVSYGLLAICLFVAVLNRFSADPLVITQYGAKVNDLITAGQYWRLITAVFLHFGPIHLAFNMLFLFSMGPGIEALFGHWRFLVIFLAAGLLGGIASFAFTVGISAGASGALFGLMGAYLYFWLRRPKMGRRIGRDILLLIAYNAMYGFIVPSVDNWAHFGGLLGGFLSAAVVGIPQEGRQLLTRVAGLAAFFVAASLGFGYGWQQEGTPQRLGFAADREVQVAQTMMNRNRDYAGAEPYLRNALTKDPNNVGGHYLLGIVYLSQTNYRQAAAEFTTVVKDKPDLPEGQFYLGLSLAKLGENQAAIKYLSQAVKLRPQDSLFLQTLQSLVNGQPLH
ncbi:MAG TPA: rhomboid family intramembrane serine protease [Desulfobacteria bacterium]|nr:rhomboid family intramembrane serine protease [Desulfobacteria bacterium]